MRPPIPAWHRFAVAIIAGIGVGMLIAVAVVASIRNRSDDPSSALALRYQADPATFSRLYQLTNPDNKGKKVSPDDLAFLVTNLDHENRGIRKHALLGLLTRRDVLGVGYAQQLVEDRFFLPQFVPDRDIMLLVLFRLSPESEAKWTTWANQHPEWRPMVEVHHQWKAARKPSHL